MIEYVCIAKAAHLLGVCRQRVQKLLYEGRIEGAFKEGRFWKIPLYNKMPKIIPGTRGPEGTWRKRPQKAKTYIHVNQALIRENRQKTIKDPVISIKRGNKNTYCHKVEILGGLCQLIYDPYNPKSCGATVWLEIDEAAMLINYPDIPVMRTEIHLAVGGLSPRTSQK